MLEMTMVTLKLMWRNWHWLRHVHACCILKQHYKNTVQQRLTILISFCSKFNGIHICQKLSKESSVWRSYCKNKMVQFFDSQCTILLQGVVLEESGETPKTETHQKNSNIIYTHPKSKYWNIQKKLCHLFKQTTTGVHDAFLPWKCE